MYIIYLFLVLFSFTATASNNEGNIIEEIQNTENTQNINNTPVETNTTSTPQTTNSVSIQQIEIPKKWEDIQNKNSFPLMDGEFLLEKNQKHFLVYENPGTAKSFKIENEELKKHLSGRIQLHYPCVLKENTGIENIRISYKSEIGEKKNISEIRSIQPKDIFILACYHKTAPLKSTNEKDELSLPDIFIPYFNWIGDKTSITYGEYMDLLKKDY